MDNRQPDGCGCLILGVVALLILFGLLVEVGKALAWIRWGFQ